MKWSEFLKSVAVASRVREPSSWAGAAVIVQGAAAFFPQYGLLITAVSAALGAVAVKLPETVGAVPESGPLASVVGPEGGGP